MNLVFHDADILARLELLRLVRGPFVVIETPLGVHQVFLEGALGIVIGRGVDFLGRINAFRPAPFFDPGAEVREEPVDRDHGPGDQVGALVEFEFSWASHQFLEEGGILLRAPIVMGADVAQIGAVGQGVLSDEVNVPAIEGRVMRLFAGRNEALAKNHVSGVEPPRVRAAEQDGVRRHLRVNQVALWPLHHGLPLLLVVAQFAIGSLERRSEHVVPEPVAEQMPVLLVFFPMGQDGVGRHRRKHRQQCG